MNIVSVKLDVLSASLNLDIKILNKSFWTMAAQVAKQYRHGRIFLVGDAAHRLPPTGGLGMNTGVADAHNLAWKIAFVLKYGAGDSLLDTYYEERAPIAKRNMEWSTENAKRFFEIFKAIHAGDLETLKIKLHEQQKNLNYEGLDLGFIYHSKAVQSENDQVISVSPDKYIPTTLPGSRAPHVYLKMHGKQISTLDLFEKTFVLLISSDGEPWRVAAEELNKTISIPLSVYKIEQDLYEISPDGAVLVRPDGHVAWRSKSMVENPKKDLKQCFKGLIDSF